MEMNAPSTSVVPIEPSVENMKIETVDYSLPTFEPKVENISSMFNANIPAEQVMEAEESKQDAMFAALEDARIDENKSIIKDELENVLAKTESTVDENESLDEAMKQECAIKDECGEAYDSGKQELAPVKSEDESKICVPSGDVPEADVANAESKVPKVEISLGH